MASKATRGVQHSSEIVSNQVESNKKRLLQRDAGVWHKLASKQVERLPNTLVLNFKWSYANLRKMGRIETNEETHDGIHDNNQSADS